MDQKELTSREISNLLLSELSRHLKPDDNESILKILDSVLYTFVTLQQSFIAYEDREKFADHTATLLKLNKGEAPKVEDQQAEKAEDQKPEGS